MYTQGDAHQRVALNLPIMHGARALKNMQMELVAPVALKALVHNLAAQSAHARATATRAHL